MSIANSGSAAWAWVDTAQTLDQWRPDGRSGVVRLYALRDGPEDGFAVAFYPDDDGDPRLTFALRSGDDLVVQGHERALRHLRSRRRPAGLRRMKKLLPLVTAMVLVVGACGSGDNGESSGVPEETSDVGTKSPEQPSTTEGLSLDDCAVVPPDRLLSGAEPGDPEEDPDRQHTDAVRWGEGSDELLQVRGAGAVEASGESAFDLDYWRDEARLSPEHDQWVQVSGEDRIVMPIGDPPLGGISIHFVRDGCPYSFGLPSGTELDDAIAFAEENF